MTEIYLLFMQSVLPTFNDTSKFLQRVEQLIHCLEPPLFGLLKKLLSKFVKPSLAMINNVDGSTLFSTMIQLTYFMMKTCDRIQHKAKTEETVE